MPVCGRPKVDSLLVSSMTQLIVTEAWKKKNVSGSIVIWKLYFFDVASKQWHPESTAGKIRS